MKLCFVTREHADQSFFESHLAAHDLEFVREMPGVGEGTEVLSVFVHDRVDQAALQELPGLPLMATRSTGFDHIDLEACRRRGILVANVPAYGENTVAEHVIVATGSRPAYNGVEKFGVLNSNQFLRHATVPGHLFVIGGGYVGCELAAIHRTLGARVTLAEARPRLLSGWDEEIGQHMQRTLENVGVEVLLNNPVSVPTELTAPPRFQLGNATVVTPDLTLVATGRVPNVEGLGLEALNLAPTGFIPVNEHLQTRVKSVDAIGDVNGTSLLDSVASAQARVAVETIRGVPARFDLNWIPRCLHTEPPIASTGWTEAEANAAGQDVEVLAETLQSITDDDATVIEPEPTRLKVVVQTGTARILGCVAIGHHAVELVNLTSTAIRYGLTARQLADLSPERLGGTGTLAPGAI